MVKHTRWWMLALSGVVLCAVAYFFWHMTLAHSGVRQDTGPSIESGVEEEPITPIPLELKLDASKVALGQRLFYDTQLSHDNIISCSTCHDLTKGGADGLPYPIQRHAAGKRVKINTLTVFNSGFNFRLFWDGRAATLEDQMDFPLQHPAELATTWPEVIAKLDKDATYRRDFAAIYPLGILQATIKDAIATFERSLITPNAKFDRFLRGDKHAVDQRELAGYQLFKNLGCINCHQGMNVGGNLYQKLGMVGDYFADRGHVSEVDFGRYNVTKIEADRYRFRVASLRNVALTAPYFHDASADTLEKAVATMGKYQLGVALSSDEIALIVKFLKTLTGEYQGKPLQRSAP